MKIMIIVLLSLVFVSPVMAQSYSNQQFEQLQNESQRDFERTIDSLNQEYETDRRFNEKRALENQYDRDQSSRQMENYQRSINPNYYNPNSRF